MRAYVAVSCGIKRRSSASTLGHAAQQFPRVAWELFFQSVDVMDCAELIVRVIPLLGTLLSHLINRDTVSDRPRLVVGALPISCEIPKTLVDVPTLGRQAKAFGVLETLGRLNRVESQVLVVVISGAPLLINVSSNHVTEMFGNRLCGLVILVYCGLHPFRVHRFSLPKPGGHPVFALWGARKPPVSLKKTALLQLFAVFCQMFSSIFVARFLKIRSSSFHADFRASSMASSNVSWIFFNI